MPDQDRKAHPLHTLSQDPGSAKVRCPSCPGFRVTFQADCVCCGRDMACQDSTADGITKSVKALSIKSKDSETAATVPRSASRAVEEILAAPVSGRSKTPANGRQRRGCIPVLRSLSKLIQRPVDAARDGVGHGSPGMQLGPGGSRSSIRIYQQPGQYVVRASSSRKTTTVGRGSSRLAVKAVAGAHHDFKGVRTRKGVKGFLVEIRPPKWKKTIWLGTYNTSIEAAGAYDAGVFYTKKSSTKYNFHTSVGAFPPLPAHLRLDRADSMEEIKVFVQSQAREAARRMGSAFDTAQTHPGEQQLQQQQPEATSTSSESCLTSGNADDLPATNSSEGVDSDGEFQIPMDLDYLSQLHVETAEETAENMFLDYTTYQLNQQEGPDQQLLLAEDENP